MLQTHANFIDRQPDGGDRWQEQSFGQPGQEDSRGIRKCTSKSLTFTPDSLLIPSVEMHGPL